MRSRFPACIAQNELVEMRELFTPHIAETCQKYFQSFISIEILSQHLYQVLQNMLSQHYNFNFLKYRGKQMNI